MSARWTTDSDRCLIPITLLCLPVTGGGTFRDTAIRPSVCPVAQLPYARYRHAGCLQLSHVRTAEPFADGRRSIASPTAIGVGHIVSPPLGRYLFWHMGAINVGLKYSSNRQQLTIVIRYICTPALLPRTPQTVVILLRISVFLFLAFFFHSSLSVR